MKNDRHASIDTAKNRFNLPTIKNTLNPTPDLSRDISGSVGMGTANFAES